MTIDKSFKPKGKISKFNERLHQKYDIPARAKVQESLKEFIIENPDKYGPDMIFQTNKKLKYKYLELQVCTNWRDNYPFKNLYIYERKGRYENDTLFLTLSRDLSKGYLFDISKIDKDSPVRIKKYSREFVYNIPWNQVMLVYMEYLTPDIILNF